MIDQPLQLPGLLTHYHRIDDPDDARAYITWLQTVGQPIDAWIAEQRRP